MLLVCLCTVYRHWLIPRVGIASEALNQKFGRRRRAVPMGPGRAPSRRCRKSDPVWNLGNTFRKGTSYSRWRPMTSRSMYAWRKRNSTRRAPWCLSLAEDTRCARQAILLRQNATVKQLARQSEIEVAIERAIVACKEVALAKAQLVLSRIASSSPSQEPLGNHL